ncbi:hypothetical protein DPMN_071125 [Dreissena polymorpha]|uniref:Uncharacterized protein n=1 Tax=Dreissena polymorpha TaxID=45954 RepID=A0A9D3Z676_DREPO|nr:hypothetical protein DPMN_071125 [Dreissena polymorpha]
MQPGFDLNTSTGTVSMQDYAQETLAGGDRQAGQKNSWMVNVMSYSWQPTNNLTGGGSMFRRLSPPP